MCNFHPPKKCNFRPPLTYDTFSTVVMFVFLRQKLYDWVSDHADWVGGALTFDEVMHELCSHNAALS
jgi:hypothetical protein